MTSDGIKITPEMQLAFARLSGDANPQHIDDIAARRLMFGRPVVHGIHSLLRALELIVQSHPACCALNAVRVSFDAPVGVGVELRLETEGEYPALKFGLFHDTQRVVRGRFDFNAYASARGFISSAQPDSVCRVSDTNGLAGRSGEVALGFDAALLLDLFPNLAATFDLRQVALLLATTRLVGMECPGLHSIYGGLRMTFADPPPERAQLSYRVATWNPEFRMLQLDIASGGSRGTIDCFLRPIPVPQPTMAAVKQIVAPGEFADQHALVVGGSRGLGEVVAKIVAAGGGASTITFATGRADANQVVADIMTQGGTASAVPFDVRAPRSLEPPAVPFTHLYYFATPRIRPNAGKALDAALLRELFDYYCVGLIRTVEVARAHLAKEAVICAPSTIFIDHPDPNFREYAAAKRAAEAVAQQLGGSGMRIYCPRLPRLRTDQTNALRDVGAIDALQPMLDMVRAARRQPIVS